MTFVWARMLWLLFLVPLLAAAYLIAQRRRHKYALRFASLSVVKEALGKGPGFRRHVPPILFLAAMTVVVVALARPATTVTLPSQRATIILAMDVSGSMRADDVAPSRIEAAQAAARAFVERQPAKTRIGVVTFAESAAVVQAPTIEREAVVAAIGRLRTFRGTAIGLGILTSLDAILEEYGKPRIVPSLDPGALTRRGYGYGSQDPGDLGFGSSRNSAPLDLPAVPEGETFPSAVIVLLSDGQSNTGPDPLEVVSQAAGRGIRVYTVGLGSPEGTVLRAFNRSMRVRLDEETLKRIAERTNGSYSKAETETDLRSIYGTLGTRLVFERQKTEITALFVGLAALLLLAAGSLSLVWFNRLP